MKYTLIVKLDPDNAYHPHDGLDYFVVQEIWDNAPVLAPELQIEQCADDSVDIGWLFNPADSSFAAPPPFPMIFSLTPNSLAAGGANATIDIAGEDFLSSSTVVVNGVDQPTTYVDAGHLQFTAQASTAAPGDQVNVQVRNAPRLGRSFILSFT